MDRSIEPDGGYALTTFLVAFFFGLMLVLGIVVDGGAVLAERRLAINHAGAASRLGAAAQSREGSTGIDPVRARQEIDSYLSAKGLRYDVTFDCAGGCQSVTVTVHSSARMRILGAIGVNNRAVHGSMTSRSARGTDVETD
jgi:Flp pilus assembly protein TadG